MPIEEPPTVWMELGLALSSWNVRKREWNDVLAEFVRDLPKAEREKLREHLKDIVSAELRSDEYRKVYASMGSDLYLLPRGRRNKVWREVFESMLRCIESGGKNVSST